MGANLFNYAESTYCEIVALIGQLYTFNLLSNGFKSKSVCGCVKMTELD